MTSTPSPRHFVGTDCGEILPTRAVRTADGTRRRRVAGVVAALAAVLALTPAMASAQTPYIPYYGKNQIRYDNFRWQIYTTDHFEIYYYPEIEQHLERMASYAESAYQYVSSELKYDLAFKIP